MKLPEQFPLQKGINTAAFISVLVIFVFLAGFVWLKLNVKSSGVIPFTAFNKHQVSTNSLEVRLLKDGSFLLAGQTVPAVKLKDVLKNVNGIADHQELYLFPEPDTVYSRVVIAADLLRSFGFTNIVLGIDRE